LDPGAGAQPGENDETTVSEDLIRRMLSFKEGDRYSEELLFSSQRNLYNLDLFRYVRIDPDSVSDRAPTLPHSIQVAPGPVHRFRTGGGFSTAECLSAEARWSSMNFLGCARGLPPTEAPVDFTSPVGCRISSHRSWSQQTFAGKLVQGNSGNSTGSFPRTSPSPGSSHLGTPFRLASFGTVNH